jgi:uncharacterized damage-inducible protein DinB
VLSAVAAQYQRWFQYEKDSHAKVLASLDTVPEEQRGSASFQKALNIMGHVVAARRMWLFRLGVLSRRPLALFPVSTTWAELSTELGQMEQEWSAFLDSLSEPALERVLEYQSMEGGWYRSIVADILTQLYGHSLYHRGQIAVLVRSLGGEPTGTDFILWSREAIPGR